MIDLPGLPKGVTSWHSKRLRSFRYVGSKIRIVPKIAEQLHATGATTICDVFGGSGAVIMNSGFTKRIYNDICGDVVNFFRVVADDELRPKLLQKLKHTPMSREIFNDLNSHYLKGGHSFEGLNPVSRAFAIFYRSSFAFGGKVKNGGFSATLADRDGCKEIKRYFGLLRDFAKLGNFWKSTVIEQMSFDDLIELYGSRSEMVFYCDPPYVSTEGYYSRVFSHAQHFTLSTLLTAVPAAAVVSYYDCELVRDLYREEDGWKFTEIEATKNSMGKSKHHTKVIELLIRKEAK